MTKLDRGGVEQPRLPPGLERTSLEQIAVRALSRPAASGSRGGWSEAAKHRLYARMFPDQSAATTVPHVKPAA